MRKWRFIDSGCNNPYRNMALDESILEAYKKTRQPVLRVYSWRPYGFSLGYSQDTEKVLFRDKCESKGIAYVRRITGGTIIYHGPEITYSLVCSETDLETAKTVKESFKVLCSFLFSFYEGLGKTPYFALENKKSSLVGSSFCFACRQDYDILIDDKKIGGNAQRRIKDIIFQHGSIPLSLDVAFIQSFLKENIGHIQGRITYLSEFLAKVPDTVDLIGRLKKSFKAAFSCELEQTGLLRQELIQADFLEKNKYRSQNWNLNRNPVNLNG
jgi:lipoyl(octanoyl) transferase